MAKPSSRGNLSLRRKPGKETEKPPIEPTEDAVSKSPTYIPWTRGGHSDTGCLREELPMDSAPLASRLTYSWLTPLMTLGNQRNLEISDLRKVPGHRSASKLSSRLDAAFENYCEQTCGTLDGEAAHHTPGCQANLPKALNSVVGPFFWIGGLCKIFADISQMMGPVLIKAIINFAKERSKAGAAGVEGPSIVKGLLLALGLLSLTVTTSLIHHQFFWRSIISGTLSRTALISSMYRRSIGLSNKSKAKLSNATIINFISTDVSRVEACAQWFHPVWAAPIQVSICLIILLYQLGPSALAGFAIFLLVIPLQKRILGRQFRIRKRLGKLTELRTKSLIEALGSMHFVKCYTLETPILNRITALRRAEVAGVKDIQNVQSANAALAFSLPVLAATLAFVTYSRSGDFDLAVMFASLSLFQLLRQPMTFWPRALSLTGDALSSLRRLSSIYTAEPRPRQPLSIDKDQSTAVLVQNATFEWEATEPQLNEDAAKKTGTPSSPFTLKNVNLSVSRGGLVAIVGPVGSGKSTFLQGLIGEIRRTSGEVIFGGSVAYCPQVPWIQKGSIRNNIVFGQAFDEERYWRIVKDVCLLEDLRDLANGDLTQIGENGLNISGGQRQRIGLARALYSNTDILVLDDPLSGVDARVGNEVFKNAILDVVKSKQKTILMVTYSRDLLASCDRVLYLQNGAFVERSTLDDALLDLTPGRPEKTIGKQSRATSANTQSSPPINGHAHAKPSGKVNGSSSVAPSGSKPTARTSPGEVYQAYLLAAQGVRSIPTLFAATVFMQGSQVLSSRILVWWQTNTFNRGFAFYQALYATFGILQAFSTFILGTTVDSISCLVSQNIHDQAMRSVLHAPMTFFESTPRGRILSAFGKDVDSIDNQLPSSIRTLCLTIATVVGSIAVITYIQPYLTVVAFLVIYGYRHFHQVHRKTARQIKRLESGLRANVYAHIAESLNGVQTLRSYGRIQHSIDETNRLLDLQNRASLVAATNQRWLSVRIDFCGAILVFAVALCAILGVGGISAPQIGLILTYTTTLTQMAGLLTRQIADVEIQMNAFERLSEYDRQKLFDQEGTTSKEVSSLHPPHNWPEHGSISLKNVSVNYRPGHPDVLRDVSLDIRPGEKIGIVGRTGAGKSSLVNCLVRIVDYSGVIEIDGLDISTLSLQSLRSKISFVPQQPVVFGGTVRSALDPHGQYDDQTLLNALGRGFRRMESVSGDGSSGENLGANFRFLDLDDPIDPEGTNLSLGERALLGTARVLLRNSKIVILDEATASVDLETDELVQRAIHKEFRDRTLVCIAHRIRTVLAYDRILVLDAGKSVELDTPRNLFMKGGHFRELCSESLITEQDILSARWTTDS